MNSSLQPRLGLTLLGLALALLPASCNLSSTSGGSAGMIGQVGEIMTDPGGTQLFFNDSNEAGAASRIRLDAMYWGREVDVYGLDRLTGLRESTPRFRDFVVNENIESGVNFVVETNPVTQETSITVQTPTTLATGEVNPVFADFVRQLEQGLGPIEAKNDDGSSAAPFSFIARNATLVLQFDDLLDDSADAEANLPFTVQILQGYPPTLPFSPRMRFDPNHGGVREGHFHSTRILVDMTVSETEALQAATALQINALGLESSLASTDLPNVSVRIPTTRAPSVGQFEILESVTGKPLATDNGPMLTNGTTNPIVRAMRSGNGEDQNNGFLLDTVEPEIVGEWPVSVSNVLPIDAAPDGSSELFTVNAVFTSDCKDAAQPGDIVQLGSAFLEVLTPNSLSGGGASTLNGLELRSLVGPLLPVGLTGNGAYLSTFDGDLFTGSLNLCWLSITPQPTAGAISPDATIQVRFTEPMDPKSLDPFENVQVVRGTANFDEPGAQDLVVGDVNSSVDLRRFVFEPALPLFGNDFHLRVAGDVDGVTDLAGNLVAEALPFVDLPISSTAGVTPNGSFVLRFNSQDELTFDGVGAATAEGNNDLRGQFFYDFERGVIMPRPVTRAGYPADRENPVPALMATNPAGTQTPLSPLGSKLQTVWRYCDLAFNLLDETVYNLDVEGISWAPAGGNVVADFYTDFEMRLSHSNRLPDEVLDPNSGAPLTPNSGLRGAGEQYSSNIANNFGALDENINPAQRVMHPRTLGYQVSPVDLFLSSSGTFMLPFPLNQNDDLAKQYYTWRDTTMRVRTAPAGAGIPLGIEAAGGGGAFGLDLYDGDAPGSFAPIGRVPSIGLPLLMEFRCYPSNTGIGLNTFDISFATPMGVPPNFRSYSTGGTNTQGLQISKDPDLELTPTGGFNPASVPLPGSPTTFVADGTFYIGQLDTVTRVSIIHTIWLDAGQASTWLDPQFEPRPEDQPLGTQVRFDYRGATSIANTPLQTALDAGALSPYGDLSTANQEANAGITFTDGSSDFVTNLNDLDGSRFVQVRMALINNVETGLNPELSSFGFAYENL